MERGHFEGLKTQYRQTKEGMVISFVIHPNEDPGWLAKAPLGQRLQVAWAEIVDEQVSAGDVPTNAARADGPNTSRQIPPSAAPAGPRPKRDWGERTPAERAGILCADPQFRMWVAAGQLYVEEQWAWDNHVDLTNNPEEACANWLRKRCGVSSRAQLTTNPDAHAIFAKIERAFRARNEPPVVPEHER